MKYLKEMKIDATEILKIIKIIEAGSFLRNKGRELVEMVGFADVEFIDKETGETDEICKESTTPYVIVGDAEVVQINVDVDENAKEISWGSNGKYYKVKCVVTESEIEYDIFIMRRRECIADIKIVPKTPVVLVEVEDENSCWLGSKHYHLYVHPFGWWIYTSKHI